MLVIVAVIMGGKVRSVKILRVFSSQYPFAETSHRQTVRWVRGWAGDNWKFSKIRLSARCKRCYGETENGLNTFAPIRRVRF